MIRSPIRALLVVVLLSTTLLACKLLKKKSGGASVNTPTASASAPVAAWQKLAGDEFEAAGPGIWAKSSQAIGEVEATVYTATTANSAFQIAHTDFPAKTIRAANPKKLLKDSEKGALDKVAANPTGSKEITLDGNPGREFTATFSREGLNGDYAGRLILVRNRLYHLQVVAISMPIDESEKQRFFSSFKLLDGGKEKTAK
jgi:hypothetical protein